MNEGDNITGNNPFWMSMKPISEEHLLDLRLRHLPRHQIMAYRGCSSKKWAIAVGILAGILLTLSIVLIALYGTFDKLVDRMIAKSVVITPSSTVYPQWVSPETPIYFSIYLFNITNHEDILKGAKPRIQQIGPYVYREKREKTNITWPKGDYSQVSFYQRITYTFDREHSVGDPDKDRMIGISTPFVTIAANMEAGNGPSSFEYSMMEIFQTPKLFIHETVNKYIWGYKDPITYVCNTFSSTKCPTPYVGIMLSKNGTDDGPFVIDTGVNDISQLGNVLTYKNQSKLNVWATEKANRIIGTDGSQVPPFLDASSRRFIFAAELCRSFEMRINGPGKLTNSDKVEVLSLAGTPETAQPVSKNPDNIGFCPEKTPGPTCPPYGTFDLSSCRRQGDLRPPIYSSQPCFLGADPKLREGVEGLCEPSENASTKVLVQPKLGLVLEAYKRLMISVYVRPSTVMPDQFKNWTQPVFLPMVWFEEKAVAGKKDLDVLYEGVYVLPVKGRRILLIVLCVTLVLLLLAVLAFLIILIRIRRKHPRPGDGVKPANTAGANIFEAKYSKIPMTQPNEQAVGI